MEDSQGSYAFGGGLFESESEPESESDSEPRQELADTEEAELPGKRLENQGWTYVPSGSRGRHNEGIYRKGNQIAKIERVSVSLDAYTYDDLGNALPLSDEARDAYYERITRNLDAWIALGKLKNVVQLFDYEMTPMGDFMFLVTMMEMAPGAEMSVVLIESDTPVTGTDIAGWSRARYKACVSVYRQSGFWQGDWKADNMFGMIDPITNQKTITFIDMPFDMVYPKPLPFGYDMNRDPRVRTSWQHLLSWDSDAYDGRYQISVFPDRIFKIVNAAVFDCISHGGTPNDVFALLENPGRLYESSIQKAEPLKENSARLLAQREQITADNTDAVNAENARHEKIVAVQRRAFRDVSAMVDQSINTNDKKLAELDSWVFDGLDFTDYSHFPRDAIPKLIRAFQAVDWPSELVIKEQTYTQNPMYGSDEYESDPYSDSESGGGDMTTRFTYDSDKSQFDSDDGGSGYAGGATAATFCDIVASPALP